MTNIVRPISVCVCILIAALLAVNTSLSEGRTLHAIQTAEFHAFKELDQGALDTSMAAIVRDNPGLNLSISITDLQTDHTSHYGEDAEFMAASIGKLVTATLFLHEVELNTRDLNKLYGRLPASVQLEKLLVESDNQAWQLFNNDLTHDKLNTYAKDIGLKTYNASDNTVTSSDIALLLSKLASGKLLNNEHTDTLLSYLKRATMRAYLVAGTPNDATIYHKTGYLKDRMHDASIITKGDRSFVLVVFSKTVGDYNFERSATVFQAIAKKTSEIFLQSKKAS